jgi:hypothetical protein
MNKIKVAVIVGMFAPAAFAGVLAFQQYPSRVQVLQKPAVSLVQAVSKKADAVKDNTVYIDEVTITAKQHDKAPVRRAVQAKLERRCSLHALEQGGLPDRPFVAVCETVQVK